MTDSRWRNHCAPIIARVIAAHPDGVGLKAALREAYPYHERRYHPYRVWLDEVARQTGRKPKLGTRVNIYGKAMGKAEPDPNQGGLFE